MYSFDLLIPILTLAATLIPLLYVQRWIHRHLFGMGYLLAHEKGTATLFYYLFLAPGVFLHEFSQYLVAGIFAVRARKFNFVPEAQEDGSLEFGFIQLEEVKNPVWGAIIGLTPLVAGLAAVIWISQSLLDLPELFTAIRINDLTIIGAALNKLIHKPDFLLWMYVLFAVANTMTPSKEGRRSWWILAAIAGVIFLYFTIIGLEEVIIAWMEGPIANLLYSLSSVFGMVLGLNLFVAGIIWTIEFTIERVTGNRVEYAPALPSGNQKALAAPQPKSVFDLRLPIPAAPGKAPVKPAAKPSKLPAGAPARPAAPLGSTAAQPAFGSGPRPAPKPGSAAPGQPTGASPATGTGAAPRPGAAPSSPFGAKPAAASAPKPAGASGATGARPPQPAQPAKPISGPPALARPTAPQPTPKPGAAPGQKPGTPPGAARPASPFGGSRRDDDYIDADVIDEDEDDYDEDDE